MAKREIDAPVRLSVLDRLLDSDPKSGVEAPLTRAQSLREMKASLRRDLEWLLNTRQPLHAMAENPRDLQGTIYDYGLPDITSLSLRSAKDQSRLLRTIESTIAAFEPRLLGVKVSLQPLSESNRSLHFLIEGLLRVDPSPEHVYFDTVLETNTGEYEVKGEVSAR